MVVIIDQNRILPVAPSAGVPAPAAGANGAVNINCCKMIIYVTSYHVIDSVIPNYDQSKIL